MAATLSLICLSSASPLARAASGVRGAFPPPHPAPAASMNTAAARHTGICRVEHMKPSRPICAALEDRSD